MSLHTVVLTVGRCLVHNSFVINALPTSPTPNTPPKPPNLNPHDPPAIPRQDRGDASAKYLMRLVLNFANGMAPSSRTKDRPSLSC